jgi:hypothetical protein
MRKILLTLGALTAAVAAPALGAAKADGETQLARELEGRTAGEPVSCISLRDTRSSRIIKGTAIVYESGSTLYVNRPRGAQSLDGWDVLVTKLHGSSLCRMDSVQLYDPSARMQTGFVILGDFVPYRKARPAGD